MGQGRWVKWVFFFLVSFEFPAYYFFNVLRSISEMTKSGIFLACGSATKTFHFFFVSCEPWSNNIWKSKRLLRRIWATWGEGQKCTCPFVLHLPDNIDNSDPHQLWIFSVSTYLFCQTYKWSYKNYSFCPFHYLIGQVSNIKFTCII